MPGETGSPLPPRELQRRGTRGNEFYRVDESCELIRINELGARSGGRAPSRTCARAGRGFRRRADVHGLSSGEQEGPLQMDVGTLENA
jgi:hypothetical protein